MKSATFQDKRNMISKFYMDEGSVATQKNVQNLQEESKSYLEDHQTADEDAYQSKKIHEYAERAQKKNADRMNAERVHAADRDRLNVADRLPDTN